jgi:hypothetical protein
MKAKWEIHISITLRRMECLHFLFWFFWQVGKTLTRAPKLFSISQKLLFKNVFIGLRMWLNWRATADQAQSTEFKPL